MTTPSTVELLLRMVLSLALMGGLSWAALRLTRNRRGAPARAGRARTEPIEVHSRRALSRSSSLTLVSVGERTLLLGVGDGAVRVLAEGCDLLLPDAPVAAAVELDLVPVSDRAGTRAPWASGPGPARMGVVDALRELTARR